MTSRDATRPASTGGPAAAQGGPRTIVHLVPHTHWDREWYQPFQIFRMRLVDLIDVLLERMAADDATALHPRRTGRDRRRLPRGPPEAEPLIAPADRRGAAGDRAVADPARRVPRLGRDDRAQPRARLGARGGARRDDAGRVPARTCSGTSRRCPRSCGGRGSARPSSGAACRRPSTQHVFDWTAPDGSTVRDRVPGRRLRQRRVPVRRPGPARGQARRVLPPERRAFYGDRSLLAMYGTDHAVPSAQLADLVDAVNAADATVEVRMETLAGVPARRGSADRRPTGQQWTGELRSGARANMLMNVVSARVDLKAAAARAERRTGALRRAAGRDPRRPVAGAAARARVAADGRQLGARLDLWLLPRCRGRPGPRPLRRGGADRQRDRRAGHGPDRRARRWRADRRGQPVAGRSQRRGRDRDRRPAGRMDDAGAPRRRRDDGHPGSRQRPETDPPP